MVQDLQRTLARKNDAVNGLQEKSMSLKRAMQPRMAYKYAPRTSKSNLHEHVQSHYGFLNQKSKSHIGDPMNATGPGGYGKRSNSTVAGVAPASGNDIGMMKSFN